MASEALRELSARIAGADGHLEPALLRESFRVLSTDAGAPCRDFARMGAFHEAAITLFRAVLPELAFQFGALPTSASRPGCAQVWRAGDASARVYCAATPALALLSAACSEAAAREERLNLSRCLHCKGSGWTIASDGGKQICQHTD